MPSYQVCYPEFTTVAPTNSTINVAIHIQGIDVTVVVAGTASTLAVLGMIDHYSVVSLATLCLCGEGLRGGGEKLNNWSSL